MTRFATVGWTRIAVVFLLAVVFSAPLSACGKKGKLEPPKDETTTYPRKYPSE